MDQLIPEEGVAGEVEVGVEVHPLQVGEITKVDFSEAQIEEREEDLDLEEVAAVAVEARTRVMHHIAIREADSVVVCLEILMNLKKE